MKSGMPVSMADNDSGAALDLFNAFDQNCAMQRYQGEQLPPHPNIAVVTHDNLGNFVIATPLMKMLAAQHGAKVDYYGGSRVMELAEASPLVRMAYALHGSQPLDSARFLVEQPYDLVVNVEWTCWAKAATSILARQNTFVCGPCVNADGRGDLPFQSDARGQLWQDQDWIAIDLAARYPFLQSGHISEIFCRLAYLSGSVPAYELPSITPQEDLPDVWLSATASLPEKLWPIENWLEVLRWLQARYLRVGLLGAKPSEQSKFWKGGTDEDVLIDNGVEDFRGVFKLPEVVGAIRKARLVTTLDNGILHLACGAGTPTVGLFREGIHRLWAPPVPFVRAVIPAPGEPVSRIEPYNVIATIDQVISQGTP